MGTQNDSGHLAGPFILPWDPLGPPRPCRPSVAQPVVLVEEFQGLSGLCITFMPPPLLMLRSSGGKNAALLAEPLGGKNSK